MLDVIYAALCVAVALLVIAPAFGAAVAVARIMLSVTLALSGSAARAWKDRNPVALLCWMGSALLAVSIAWVLLQALVSASVLFRA